VIHAVEDRADLDLIVAGGVYQRTTRSFVGPAVLHALEGLALDVAVISVAGIDDGWLLGGDALDAAVKRALMAAARRVIVVADASKIGARAAIRLARLEAVDDLVTDDDGARALDLPAHSALRVAVAPPALVT
jgi:DeoR/GlpR family transcriptional regulator of sugar metabolism